PPVCVLGAPALDRRRGEAEGVLEAMLDERDRRVGGGRVVRPRAEARGAVELLEGGLLLAEHEEAVPRVVRRGRVARVGADGAIGGPLRPAPDGRGARPNATA